MLNHPYDYTAHLAAVTGPTRGAAGAAWRCDTCRVWWGTQVNPRPSTKFLLQLPMVVAEQLGWDDYRGWKLKLDEACVCPECGRSSGRLVYATS